MQQVDHPNIVKYYETYDDKKFIYLCMELCTGGELFQKVTAEGKISESKTAEIMMKLLRALNHCHADNIIHRDIKPENVMFGVDGEVKLIDFGFAIHQHLKKANMDVAGTPYYIAPEVLSGNYGKECDLWSLGVVLYQMLTGIMPFDGNSQEEVFGKIKRGKFAFPNDDLSAKVKDLIKRMITVDVNTRATMAQCMSHAWFQLKLPSGSLRSTNTSIDPEVIKKLQKFRKASTLRNAAINVLVKHMDAK